MSVIPEVGDHGDSEEDSDSDGPILFRDDSEEDDDDEEGPPSEFFLLCSFQACSYSAHEPIITMSRSHLALSLPSVCK